MRACKWPLKMGRVVKREEVEGFHVRAFMLLDWYGIVVFHQFGNMSGMGEARIQFVGPICLNKLSLCRHQQDLSERDRYVQWSKLITLVLLVTYKFPKTIILLLKFARDNPTLWAIKTSTMHCVIINSYWLLWGHKQFSI